jgi:hypothetical protein
LALAVAINRSVRQEDEWFDEPDDLDRVRAALDTVARVHDPLVRAAVLAYRIARAQAFGEGNKRTAFLVAKWTLDRNGFAGERIMPPEDRELGDLLIHAAAGRDIGAEILGLFRQRALTLGHQPSRPARSEGFDPQPSDP